MTSHFSPSWFVSTVTIFSGKSSHLLVDKIVKEMTSECKSHAILYR